MKQAMKGTSSYGLCTSLATLYEVMALYGDFITKGQNQVLFLLESVRVKSAVYCEYLYKTASWPEEIGSATTAFTDRNAAMLLRAQTCENRPLALRPIRLVTPPPRKCGGGD
jgi:hypothetical protein